APITVVSSGTPCGCHVLLRCHTRHKYHILIYCHVLLKYHILIYCHILLSCHVLVGCDEVCHILSCHALVGCHALIGAIYSSIAIYFSGAMRTAGAPFFFNALSSTLPA